MKQTDVDIELSLKLGFSDARDKDLVDSLIQDIRNKLHTKIVVPFLMERDREIRSEQVSFGSEVRV